MATEHFAFDDLLSFEEVFEVFFAEVAADELGLARYFGAEALENDVKLLIAKITEPMTATLVREKARLAFNKSRGDSVYKHFTEHLADYDFVQRKGINNNSKVLGTLAMFQAEQTS